MSRGVSTLQPLETENVLGSVRQSAVVNGLAYAGGVTPEQAWQLFTRGQAVLVDVRTQEERRFVGHVPDTLHIAWQVGQNLIRNPLFLRELRAKVSTDAVVLFLCRSGKRSAGAAAAATEAGYHSAFNVLEGFEGDLDMQRRRGINNGWRHRGLPWVQD